MAKSRSVYCSGWEEITLLKISLIKQNTETKEFMVEQIKTK